MKSLLSALLLTISVTLFSQTKVLLLEEGTGTWCQWCPRGEVFGHQMLVDHPGQVLLVALHEGDPMEIPGLSYFNNFNWGGLPGAFTNRGSNHDPAQWPSTVPSALTQPTPADISVSRSYDVVTRVMDITVNAIWFNTSSSSDYRIGALVVEDGVTGPAPTYSQSNQYAGGSNGVMGGYETLPNPVPAGLMVYDHVARGLLSPFNGVSGSVPASPQSGQTYSETFSYTVPVDQDPEYVRAYGYLVDMNTGGQIANAGTGEYAIGDFNARPFFNSDSSFLAFAGSNTNIDILAHDPDDFSLTVTAVSGLPAWATFTMNGADNAILSGTPTAAGQHTVVVEASDGNKSRIMNLQIEVQVSNNNWIQIGVPGFSSQTPDFSCRGALDQASGTAYASLVNAADQMYVYSHDGTGWAQVGNAISVDYPFGFDLIVNQSTGEPWVAYRTPANQLEIKKYASGSWVTVGSPVSGGQDIEIAFDPNGNAYVATKVPNGGPGYVYEFDGTSWNTVGGGQITVPGAAAVAWFSLNVNESNGELVLLANAFPSQTGYSHVLTWDGSAWNIVGGGPINPTAFTTGSASSLHELAVTPNGEYYAMLAHADGTDVYTWDGSAWITIADNIDNGVREVFDIKSNSVGEIFVVYQNALGGLTSEMWDGTSWSPVGTPNFTPSIDGDADMVMYANDLPGVVYIDNSTGNKLSMQRYGPPNVGISEAVRNDSKFYPNPTTGKLFVQDVNNGESYIVYDVLGHIVAAGIVDSRSVDASSFSNGVYTLLFPELGLYGRFIRE